MTDNDLDLGPCCACGREDDDVRNVLMLPKKAPEPGTGWFCLVCDLPADGALAVVCDECLEYGRPLKWAIKGCATNKERILYDELTGAHEHDLSKHEKLCLERQ